MRVSADLHPDVIAELRHACAPAEVADFYRVLARVCTNPIRHSELFCDPTVSRYALRWFSFGGGVGKIAIFYYDGRLVRVLKCRRARPRKTRRPPGPDTAAPP